MYQYFYQQLPVLQLMALQQGCNLTGLSHGGGLHLPTSIVRWTCKYCHAGYFDSEQELQQSSTRHQPGCPRRPQSTWSSHAQQGPSTALQGEVAYHGTSQAAAASIERNGFSVSSDGMLGRGVYVSRDLSKAADYGTGVVLELRVDFGRVCRVDRQGHPQQKSWHDQGFDSAWVPPNCGMVGSGREEHCVWDPARIRVVGRARG